MVGLVVLALSAVLVPLVMAFFLAWWTLLWAPIALVVIGLTVVATGVLGDPDMEPRSQFDIEPEPVEAVPVAVSLPEPDPVHRKQMREIGLPSAQEDYVFVFSATVCHKERIAPGDAHRNLAALAAELVLGRAAQLAATLSPDLPELAERRLAALLGEPAGDSRGQCEAWAENVALVLPERDVERLRWFADVRKERDVWKHTREHERDQRAYYGGDVLASQENAVAWWFAKDPSKVEETVKMVDILGELSAAANSSARLEEFRANAVREHPDWSPADASVPAWLAREEAPRVSWSVMDHASAIVDKVGADGDEMDRDGFTDRFAGLLSVYGQPDLARQLREKYQAAELSTEQEPGLFDAVDDEDDTAVDAPDSGSVPEQPGRDNPREPGPSV
ncbi:hypothetical protein Nans01_08790 [Nocardiopsis ansamitocini]|uniref:Uncharacterized protein n=2 Tax=Nocardiopsis ansamitocini TaxID=1670832 RepID=A0A9W6P3N6_9ACTN|nr:hypothetical protein Nans01_08790 [Nocardiopsis ansamitocini]